MPALSLPDGKWNNTRRKKLQKQCGAISSRLIYEKGDIEIMKTITVSLEQEKHEALSFYLEKAGKDVQKHTHCDNSVYFITIPFFLFYRKELPLPFRL